MAQSIIFKLEIEKIQETLIKAKNTYGGELFEAPEDTKKYAAYNGGDNIDLIIKTDPISKEDFIDVEFESKTLTSEQLCEIAREFLKDDFPGVRVKHEFY